MSVFQHPYRIRGVVRTPMGRFFVSRGLVEAPDEIGESLGWERVPSEENRVQVSEANPSARPEMDRRTR